MPASRYSARMCLFVLPTRLNAQTHHGAEPRPLWRQEPRLLRIHTLPNRFFRCFALAFLALEAAGSITSCRINGESTFSAVSTCAGITFCIFARFFFPSFILLSLVCQTRATAVFLNIRACQSFFPGPPPKDPRGGVNRHLDQLLKLVPLWHLFFLVISFSRLGCQTVASFGAVESSWNIDAWFRGELKLGSLFFYLDKALASLRHLAWDCMRAHLITVFNPWKVDTVWCCARDAN